MKLAAAAVLSLTAITLSACTWTEECSQEIPMSVTLRADRMCPSAKDFQARVDAEQPPTGATIHSEARPEIAIKARVVCWYRSTEAEGLTPCFLGTRQSMLADATRAEQAPSEGIAVWATGYMLSCDAEGTLYGKIILVDATDPSTALPAGPVACPDMVTPEPTAEDKVISVTTLVGSDAYPARVTCDYDATAVSWCGFDELRH
jgi:hypothetical protein